MWWAVDLLASNYGWSKQDILNDVYLDELYYLSKLINQRKITDYKMQLAIVTNPHIKDPKTLWRLLEEQEKQLIGADYIDEEFDAVGFEQFKQSLQAGGASIVIK